MLTKLTLTTLSAILATMSLISVQTTSGINDRLFDESVAIESIESFENEESFGVVVEITEDEVEKFEKRVRLNCYPASKCNGSQKDSLGLAIGQGKYYSVFVNRSEAKALFKDANLGRKVTRLSNLLLRRINPVAGAVGKALSTGSLWAINSHNAKIQKIIDNSSYRGVKVNVYIGRTYSGCTTTVEFYPWYY